VNTEPLAASKTMRLVLLTAAAILAVFIVAAIAEAVFDVRVPYVGEVLAALTGNTGIGTARNIYTDSKLRIAEQGAAYTGPAGAG
jgi:hypothetical protein